MQVFSCLSCILFPNCWNSKTRVPRVLILKPVFHISYKTRVFRVRFNASSITSPYLYYLSDKLKVKKFWCLVWKKIKNQTMAYASLHYAAKKSNCCSWIFYFQMFCQSIYKQGLLTAWILFMFFYLSWLAEFWITKFTWNCFSPVL